MAKNHSWAEAVLSFTTPSGEVVTVDQSQLPANIIAAAVKFALPTLLRNATAGLATEDPAKATERVKGRIAAWLAGNWSAKGEASAEPRTSLLARALAEVMRIEVADAAAKIESAIETTMAAQEPPCDADSEDDDEKSRCRKVAAAVRKALRETAEVAPVYKRLSDEAAAKAAEGKTAVSLSSLIK